MRLAAINLSFGVIAVALTTSITGAAKSSNSTWKPSTAPVHAIQGGASDTADTYAVGVCLPYMGRSGPGSCGGVCSGVLIAPNLVVTARHCVDATPASIDCSSATFGAQTADATQFYVTTASSMTQPALGWHQVSAIFTPATSTLCGDDIALLQLKDVIATAEATPATPAVQYPVYNHKHYGTTETAIGFGEDAPDTATTSQVRRDRQNIAVQCVLSDPIAAEDCVTQDKGWVTAARPNEFVAGNGTCEGDSGSGAFDQTTYAAGTPTVLGILSRGSASSDGMTCELGIYTRMDAFRDLIVQTVTAAAAAGDYTVPSWTTAVVDDGVYANPDAGAGGADAGTIPTADAGPLPSNLEIGEACGSGSECASGTCHASGATGSFICTTTCSVGATDSCTNGLTCAAGVFCEVATTASGADNGPSSSSSSGGCSVSQASGTSGGPGKPVPWKQAILSGLALGSLFVPRRRFHRSDRGKKA